MGLVWLAVVVLLVASMWKVFVKAGKPGWAALVPFYNLFVLLQIVGKPTWWFVLLLIPFANIVALILIQLQVAKVFSKSTGFGIGLTFLPFVFYPMLAFSDATYTAPQA